MDALRMIDVDLLRDPIIGMNELAGADAAYTFFYDETNNIRVLRNTPDGFNVREPKVFVLGGIAHRGPSRPFDADELRMALGVGKEVAELKFSQIGKGELLGVLKSDKVGILLAWLEREELFVHFQALDTVYWSLVDVVDSIVAEADEPHLYPLVFQLRDDLYTVLRSETDHIAEFLRRYDYPNIGSRRREAFLRELREIGKMQQHLLLPLGYRMLDGILRIALELDELPFIENETPNLLLDGFSAFYLQRIALFKNSMHILDIEETIMDRLAGETFMTAGTELKNHVFVDSRSEFGVQIADTVVGLLGRLFTYVNRTPPERIAQDVRDLSGRQRTNLALLARTIDRSIDENAAFASYVISMEDRRRLELLLT